MRANAGCQWREPTLSEYYSVLKSSPGVSETAKLPERGEFSEHVFKGLVENISTEINLPKIHTIGTGNGMILLENYFVNSFFLFCNLF